MNTTSRILGEARKVRPPTNRELTDPHGAYFYAEEKLRMGRFPEGEPAIATDPYWAYMYARHIIKGRWPEAEATIATSPWGFPYAWHVIGGRWPEGEATIAKDPIWAEKYLELFPEAKLEWVMNGWLDWLDL
jgi:hypothetical protein